MTGAGARAGREPSRFRLGFLNVWNALAIAAVTGLALVTKSAAPLVVGAALEGVWLTLVSSPVISRRLFARTYAAARAAGARERREAVLARLPDEPRSRVKRLDERREAVLRAAADNSRFAGGLLQSEIDKLDDLVDAFVELAGSCARWEAHLARVDFDDLESELRRAETDAGQALDDERRATARRNLEVLMSRREQLADLREKVSGARAEMELIENSFKLLADEVMVMASPHHIRGKLDDLLVTVEAVREMTRDDDALGRARGAAAASGSEKTTHG